MSNSEPTGLAGLERAFDRGVAITLATMLTLGSVAWALDFALWLELNIYPAQFFAAMLGLALPLAFIALPARRHRPRAFVPWYDWLGAVVGFAAVGYLTWEYQRLADLIILRPPDATAAGLVLIALSLEGLRRATGRTLPLIAIAFIGYALLGARATDWEKLTGYLALDVNGILGIPLAVASTIVIAFLLFGQLLNTSGGSRFFTDIAMLTMGRFRGGPAKIAVVGSGLFGSISGSAVANVVATGVITIPMIKRSGYPAHKAGAIEAVASTGGQLMPPVMGASAFLMAEFLQIPYAEVVLAALVPALLYYVALFVQADLEAAKLDLDRVSQEDIPEARGVLSGLYFVLPFAVLIVALFNFNQPPQMAALLAALVLIVLALTFGYRGQRPNWRSFLSALYGAGFAALDIIMVCVAAGVVIGVLGISGLGFTLTLKLVQIGQGSLPLLLLLSAGVCIVLGMGLPTVGVYVLLAALVAPALVEVGITPIAAHLYVMYFGMMSMITPPVAIAAFAAAGLAESEPMRTGWASVRFGWMAYVVPFLFVLSPTLLLIGEAGEITLAVITAVVGVWLVSIAIAGYFLRPLGPSLRLAFAAAGLLALTPAGAFTGAGLTDIVGVAVGLLLIGYEVLVARRNEA
ncbi:MAG: TRAP transporter fused permease subunit [Alphaproteobacteria bacterium]|nr:TRAP transporter fused permease subunit [Alphaproteobacteria bacterium]MDP6624365.1 TRAP transporter fused permease subunit [Alphaproteobacteria bacterium]